MNAAQQTILTVSITVTNQLIYITATVILEMLGYKMHIRHKAQYPWRRRLKAKIKAARREVRLTAEEVHQRYRSQENKLDAVHQPIQSVLSAFGIIAWYQTHQG